MNEDGTLKKEHELPMKFSMMLPAFRGIPAVRDVEGLSNPRGFVLTDKHQRNPKYPEIFGIGVCIGICIGVLVRIGILGRSRVSVGIGRAIALVVVLQRVPKLVGRLLRLPVALFRPFLALLRALLTLLLLPLFRLRRAHQESTRGGGGGSGTEGGGGGGVGSAEGGPVAVEGPLEGAGSAVPEQSLEGILAEVFAEEAAAEADLWIGAAAWAEDAALEEDQMPVTEGAQGEGEDVAAEAVAQAGSWEAVEAGPLAGEDTQDQVEEVDEVVQVEREAEVARASKPEAAEEQLMVADARIYEVIETVSGLSLEDVIGQGTVEAALA